MIVACIVYVLGTSNVWTDGRGIDDKFLICTMGDNKMDDNAKEAALGTLIGYIRDTENTYSQGDNRLEKAQIDIETACHGNIRIGPSTITGAGYGVFSKINVPANMSGNIFTIIAP